MARFLAIDQSTSATKALLFDASGGVVDRESRDHGQSCPRPGWVEHDAEEIWENTLQVVRALLSRSPDAKSDMVSLSITNQRETIVVFDRRSGRPLHPAIVWQCRRGDELCAAQLAAGHGPRIHEKTGLTVDSYFSASKLQWLIRHRPELGARLLDGSALIGTIDTYLIHRLTEGRVFATDSTNASRTLLFDLRQRRWDEELCALWNVPMRALPEIRECSARFGETRLGGLLSRPIPVCGVLGDSQAAMFAQRCFAPGSVKATFGTGTSLLLNIGPEPRLSANGVLTALAWVHAGVPAYALEGIVISSASTLTWLRDRLGLAPDIAEISRLAEEMPDTGGVYLVPAFAGLGLPHWNPAARAAIVGLSSYSDRRHIARAAFESIGFQIRDALSALRSEAGLPVRQLSADGGPTANPFLMQLTANLTGTALHVPAMAECSPAGAVLAGQLGLGIRRSLEDIAAMPRDETVYRPLPTSESSAAHHAGWDRALRAINTSGLQS